MATSSFDKDFIVEDPERIAEFKRTLKNIKWGDKCEDVEITGEFKKQTKVCNWISVDDELPELNGYYLCADSGGNVEIFRFEKTPDSSNWIDDNYIELMFICDVTHWMPLPDAPTKDMK